MLSLLRMAVRGRAGDSHLAAPSLLATAAVAMLRDGLPRIRAVQDLERPHPRCCRRGRRQGDLKWKAPCRLGPNAGWQRECQVSWMASHFWWRSSGDEHLTGVPVSGPYHLFTLTYDVTNLAGT
jgi:hypothetical protein